MQLPELTLPEYDLTLPVLKKKIKYRPFIVAEEKILLLALQEQGSDAIVKAMKQIADSCTFNKLKVDDLATADIEYLFINMRNKSFGEGVEILAACSNCQKKTSLMLDMTKIRVKSEKVDPEIELIKGVWVIMKYPSIDETYKLIDAEDQVAAAEDLILSCITKMIVGEKTYEFSEVTQEAKRGFINRMTHEQVERIQAFILSAPRVIFEDNYKCVHCGEENIIELEGMQSFFG